MSEPNYEGQAAENIWLRVDWEVNALPRPPTEKEILATRDREEAQKKFQEVLDWFQKGFWPYWEQVDAEIERLKNEEKSWLGVGLLPVGRKCDLCGGNLCREPGHLPMEEDDDVEIYIAGDRVYPGEEE